MKERAPQDRLVTDIVRKNSNEKEDFGPVLEKEKMVKNEKAILNQVESIQEEVKAQNLKEEADPEVLEPQPIGNEHSQTGNYKKERRRNKNGKKLILRPIEEENCDESFVSQFAYKCVFQRCHDDIKFMRIGTKTKDEFLKSPEQLLKVLLDINISKNGKACKVNGPNGDRI